MSRAKKIARMTFRILLGLIGLLLVGFLICKDPILQAVAQRAVRAETGMEVVIGKLETSLGEGTMTLSGFQLINPPEFGGGVFLDVPEAYLELDYSAATDGRLHFTVLRLNLAGAKVVKNKAGRTNLEYLEEHSRERARLRKKKKEPHEKDTVFDGIDTFYFSLGKVNYTDLKNSRNNLEVEAGLIDEQAQDLKSGEELSNWVTTKLFTVVVGELLKRFSNNGVKGLF